MAFLIEAWRQACRHSEIGDSVASLAPLIARHVPLQSLVVWRLDASLGRLQAVAAVGPGLPPVGARNELASPARAALMAWCQAGAVLHAPAVAPSAIVPLLLPPGLQG